MAYLLHMSDELHDWLADLRGTDPAAAVRVGQALAALMSEGVGLGPPLVVPVMATWPEDLVAALDASYQRRVDRLQVIRRRAADATLLVKDMQGQVDELESAQARLEDQRSRALEEDRRDDAEKAARQLAVAQREATVARQLIPWITETEAWLRTRLQRLQARTDAFRARKEVLKATYTAARAELQVNEELAQAGPADPQAAARGGGPAPGRRGRDRAGTRPPAAPAGPARAAAGHARRAQCSRAASRPRPAHPATARSASSSPSSHPAPRC